MIVKFNIPSRGIIGLRNQLLLQQLVRLLWHTVLLDMRAKGEIAGRNKGSISMEKEKQFLILSINYKIVVSFSLNQMLKSTKVR
jgi:predicted membrane GTPase involved in stress response